MGKKIIRLTESELHDFIQESVKTILSEISNANTESLVNEGQGWETYKALRNDIKNRDDYDFGEFKKELRDKETGKAFKNYLKHGVADFFDHVDPNWDTHYDATSPTSNIHATNPDAKPINKKLSGKLGRAAGLAAGIATVGAGAAKNSIRNRFKKN